jgi:hypothetical protein
MKDINQLLEEVGEDKFQNLTTTSFQFKRDFYEFFKGGFADAAAVEFGTHKGQTTRIMSHLFRHVYTINISADHFGEARKMNADRDNITYIPLDLYATSLDQTPIHEPVQVIFIDAGHSFKQVSNDIDRAFWLDRVEPTYVVFDDFGSTVAVCDAIMRAVDDGRMEIVRHIGHPKGHNFGGTPNRILMDWEGVICKFLG